MMDRRALTDHLRTKVHKRKVKDLQEEPYSHKEAEQSGGVGVYVPRTATVEREVLDAAVVQVIGEDLIGDVNGMDQDGKTPFAGNMSNLSSHRDGLQRTFPAHLL